MTPIWQSNSGPPWHGWEHGYWGPGEPWAIWLVPWLGVALLVLILMASLPWLLRRYRHTHGPARWEPPASPAPPVGPVLASDAERDTAVDVLSHAMADGRVNAEEGSQRIGAALSARYRHELSGLTSDLPPVG